MIYRQLTRTPLTTTVSVRAESKGHHVGTDAGGASRAAATGVHSQVVGAAALATAARVALGVVVAAHIGPLGERSLAKEHSASVAQLAHDVRIARDNAAHERPAAGSRVHVILGSDVVLDAEGDAVEGATDGAVLALDVPLVGNGEHVRVELHN